MYADLLSRSRGSASGPLASSPHRPLRCRKAWAACATGTIAFAGLRDAAFTLLALLNAGYSEEADDWQNWLLRAVAGSPDQLQIMYGVAGERDLPERQLDWLAGYAGSRPVRVGNAASLQIQLDIYGEIADVTKHAARGGLAAAPRREELRLAFSDKTRRARWKKLAAEIHADICAKGVDTTRGCFVQAYGSQSLDAALRLPIVGFLPPTDKRIKATVAEIEKRLSAGGLVLRYETATGVDGLPQGEGAFLPCSFWLVDIYVLMGRLAEAEKNAATTSAYCRKNTTLARNACWATSHRPSAMWHSSIRRSACCTQSESSNTRACNSDTRKLRLRRQFQWRCPSRAHPERSASARRSGHRARPLTVPRHRRRRKPVTLLRRSLFRTRLPRASPRDRGARPPRPISCRPADRRWCNPGSRDQAVRRSRHRQSARRDPHKPA
jgi:glycosyl hydrolase family 15